MKFGNSVRYNSAKTYILLRTGHPSINRTQSIVFKIWHLISMGSPVTSEFHAIKRLTCSLNKLSLLFDFFPSEILQLNSIPFFLFVRTAWNGRMVQMYFYRLHNQHLCRTYTVFIFQIDNIVLFSFMFYLFFINSTFRTFYINGTFYTSRVHFFFSYSKNVLWLDMTYCFALCCPTNTILDNGLEN